MSVENNQSPLPEEYAPGAGQLDIFNDTSDTTPTAAPEFVEAPLFETVEEVNDRDEEKRAQHADEVFNLPRRIIDMEENPGIKRYAEMAEIPEKDARDRFSHGGWEGVKRAARQEVEELDRREAAMVKRREMLDESAMAVEKQNMYVQTHKDVMTDTESVKAEKLALSKELEERLSKIRSPKDSDAYNMVVTNMTAEMNQRVADIDQKQRDKANLLATDAANARAEYINANGGIGNINAILGAEDEQAQDAGYQQVEHNYAAKRAAKLDKLHEEALETTRAELVAEAYKQKALDKMQAAKEARAAKELKLQAERDAKAEAEAQEYREKVASINPAAKSGPTAPKGVDTGKGYTINDKRTEETKAKDPQNETPEERNARILGKNKPVVPEVSVDEDQPGEAESTPVYGNFDPSLNKNESTPSGERVVYWVSDEFNTNIDNFKLYGAVYDGNQLSAGDQHDMNATRVMHSGERGFYGVIGGESKPSVSEELADTIDSYLTFRGVPVNEREAVGQMNKIGRMLAESDAGSTTIGRVYEEDGKLMFASVNYGDAQSFLLTEDGFATSLTNPDDKKDGYVVDTIEISDGDRIIMGSGIMTGHTQQEILDVIERGSWNLAQQLLEGSETDIDHALTVISVTDMSKGYSPATPPESTSRDPIMPDPWANPNSEPAEPYVPPEPSPRRNSTDHPPLPENSTRPQVSARMLGGLLGPDIDRAHAERDPNRSRTIEVLKHMKELGWFGRPNSPVLGDTVVLDRVEGDDPEETEKVRFARTKRLLGRLGLLENPSPSPSSGPRHDRAVTRR